MDKLIVWLTKIDNVLWAAVFIIIFVATLVFVFTAGYHVIKAPNKGEALIYTVGVMGLMVVGFVVFPQMVLIGTNYSLSVSLPEAVEIRQNMGLWWATFYDDSGVPLPTILPVESPTAVYIITTTPQPPPQPSPTWNYPTITPWATATPSIVTVTPLPTVKPTIDCATWNPSTPPPLPGEATSCSGGN